jgi:ElaB/YqjD/DUF883 family membrane-anchored ribosome-binding protein
MLSIPIVSSFDNKGIKKAIQEFKQLEGASAKAQFALKKAAIPATAALAGLGAALFDATKGALDDAAAQGVLARQLQRSTKATDAQIAANEEWISTQGKLLGVSDDELRPTISALSRVTGSLTKAQKGASLAMDIAAAKNIDVAQASKVLERAYGGNLTAIGRLVPEMRGMIKEGASLEEVMAELNKKFGGEAAAAAETTQGKFKRLKVAMDETKESIGEGLLPIVESALPILQKFADWASENPTAFTAIAAAIGAVALAITAVNIAMALNPFSLIAAGIALVVVGLVTAYKKFEGFRKVVDKVINSIIGAVELFANNWIKAINLVIRGINLVNPGDDIGSIKEVRLPRITEAYGGTSAAAFRLADSSNPGPSLSTPEMAASSRGVNITVNTGVGDPVAIGKSVRGALNAYDRRSS